MVDKEVKDGQAGGAPEASGGEQHGSGHGQADKPHKNFKVTVLYNGLERQVEAKPDELVKALLARAIAAFPGVVNPHMLSVFSKDGRELNDEDTIHDAGVKERDTLLLRPGAVKGGHR